MYLLAYNDFSLLNRMTYLERKRFLKEAKEKTTTTKETISVK